MGGINFSKRPQLKNPYLIVAWPGMGEVAFKAAQFLVEKLPAEEFARIDSQEFFYLTSSIIKEGIIDTPELPYNKFYYWKNKAGKKDLIIFISNAQPDLSRSADYCQRILSLVRSFEVSTVICFAAMPVPIDHKQEPSVFCAFTDHQAKNSLARYNLKIMPESQISGMNGLFLGIAKKAGFSGFCLLAEMPLYAIQIENPKASYAILEALNRILGISLELKELREQAGLVEQQIDQLIEYLKLDGEQPPPIGEEELEKIKKSLSEYSKLPQSIKLKIEKLFVQSKKDISKAHELKVELDKWNIYKEYEDRFLDLFKKPKNKGN
jgi:hypothetical protein